MSLPLTEQQIRFAVGAASFERGRRYQRQGCVTRFETDAAGRRIQADVRGSRPKPYHVHVTVRPDGARASIDGWCSCPVGFNCKHVAAALLEGLDRRPSPGDGPPPDPELERWLAALDATAKAGTDTGGSRKEVLYLLSVEPTESGRSRLLVRPMRARVLKDGSYGTRLTRADQPSSHWALGSPPDPGNLDPVELLRRTPGAWTGTGQYVLEGRPGAIALRLMVETGRCFWQDPQGPRLRETEPLPACGGWTFGESGRQHFAFRPERRDTLVLPLMPPWYLAPATGECGPLRTGLPDDLAAMLARAPPVGPRHAAELRRKLSPHVGGHADLLPREVAAPRVEATAPVPVLRILPSDAMATAPAGPRPGGFAVRQEVHSWDLPCALLTFDYAGRILGIGDPADEIWRVEDGEPVVVRRDRERERTAHRRLLDMGFFSDDVFSEILSDPNRPEEPYVFAGNEDDPQMALGPFAAFLGFLHRGVGQLRRDGWRVEVDPAVEMLASVPESDWDAAVEHASGMDWFGVSLGITVEGERVDLLPVLLPILKLLPESGELGLLDELEEADEPLFVPLPDGRMMPLPVGRARPLLEALYELYRVGGITDDGTIRLPAARAADLAAMEAAAAAAGLRWTGGERLRETGHRLLGLENLDPAEPPPGLRGELRPYQRIGLAWLQLLASCGLGGVLADDMGLGKTVQTLAHVAAEKAAGRLDRPCLVVAPTSLMTNWRREAERYTPGLSVLTLHGGDRHDRFAGIPEHDLVLTTYALLPRDQDRLLAQDWHIAVLDEAQAIKNPRAKTTLTALQLKARQRLCLTGTPLENNLEELWSLFRFPIPGLLGDRTPFQRVFRTPIEKHGDEERRQQLARRVRPFLMRRTKQQVAAELPEKTEIVEHVELDGDQRDLYESIRVAMDARIRKEVSRKGLARSHIVILDALLKLRQVCCDPRLVKLDRAHKVRQSAKLARLLEMLPEMVAEGRHILLFSQFTSMLDLIEAETRKLGIAHVRLDGGTRDRATPVERFQAGEVPLFLISLKAGGTGLNLTAADTVIHYDPWWNPAVERQATDRAHRIGQDKPVFVYKLLGVGTVEETIQALQARKQALAEGLFDPDGGALPSLAEEDLDLLLAPIGGR